MDARAIVPPLSFDLYKGQYGKVGIVGGCAEYTGAPYYAGMAALKTGVDLCHIFCTPDAAIPIKCYSPELIVHPYLGTATLGRITAVLPRLDALVLGPGLGRDPDVLSATKSIVAAATELQLPLVLDGDALYLLSTDVLLLRNYTNAILTPNTMEYGRLCVALGLLISLDLAAAAAISPQRVAAALGHVTVLQKGKIDVISDGYTTVEQPSRGIPRRCGGQGDQPTTQGVTFAASCPVVGSIWGFAPHASKCRDRICPAWSVHHDPRHFGLHSLGICDFI
ncbi:YjeF family domain-containing protein, variant 3 [Aphanomyces astaci]|uniref:ATP-dependent (S)-NAD(P)H-hydrate dehydratase n=1 Tax=Aphanomyces astaci TaxID=112090 RepID=W4GBG0_APHAT|nr:YjeF family domain-containing protein, variant 3 [Aphanomyces astaci]ETV76601.1 YjeF family domain-containing protein, variant 3 [Aphanomyces astaci]|eukprot:XP_009834147.1 YjeF family domain-containing protein, variant 3 [Aphanomyces astaci]